MYITVVYRPPNVQQREFINTMEVNVLCKNNNHIIMGDFNLNLLEENIETNTYTDIISEQGYKICNILSVENFTRPNNIEGNTIIDHVMTNNEKLMNTIEIQQNDLSDHCAIVSTWKLKTTTQEKYIEVKKIKVNYNKIQEEFKKINNTDINSFSSLINVLQKQINKNTTEQLYRRRNDNIWVNYETVQKINKKNDALKKWRKDTNNNVLKKRYYQLKKDTEKCIKERKCKFYENKFKYANGDPEKTWHEINSIMNKGKNEKITAINKIQKGEGRYTENTMEIANELNSYFAEIGEKLANKNRQVHNIDNFMRERIREKCAIFEYTNEEEILKIIGNLKSNKAVGKDKISNKLIKHLKVEIAPILVALINNIIRTGEFPNCLKEAIIKPLYKGGDKTNPGNYRPIALLSALAKISEKVLHNRLMTHLQHINYIASQQYAYQKNSSTTTAATDLILDVQQQLDNQNKIILIAIDSSKAFDTVDKKILLNKMKMLHLTNIQLNIFKTYLYNRKQVTVVNEVYSNEKQPTYGIPQGGTLAPLLYLIYCNDVHKLMLNGKIYMYADDICIRYAGKNSTDMQENINMDMKLVSGWFSDNKLTINESKTNYIIISNKLQEQANISIKINNKTIEQVSSLKYLGLHINKKLKWDNHVNNIAKNNRVLINGIRSINKYIPENQRKSIYHALFLSKINYLINIWSTTTKYNLNRLQRQQNKILKILYNKNKFTSSKLLYEQVKELNINELIKLNKCCLIHNIKHKQIKSNINIVLNKEIHRYGTRRKSELKTIKNKTAMLNRSLLVDGINEYNRLPKNIKASKKTELLKLLLRNHLLEQRNI